ncbi:MAG: Sua5/YciO/YrdC/YwlC family protein [Aliidongia sp.]
MVANEASATRFAAPSPDERALLRSGARPIVLIRRGEGLAAAVAPRLDRVGMMLPSAPLHYLLFHALAGQPQGSGWLDEPQPIALVATSANCRRPAPRHHRCRSSAEFG